MGSRWDDDDVGERAYQSVVVVAARGAMRDEINACLHMMMMVLRVLVWLVGTEECEQEDVACSVLGCE